MPSTKKLTQYRKDQLPGSRRSKPSVRLLNQQVKARIEAEHELIQKLIGDAHTRAQLLGKARGQLAPLVVWTDFDHFRDYTEIDPQRLPPWDEIGEYLKIHLLFQVILEFGGFSFTARIRPDLEDKWVSEGRNALGRIRRLVPEAMKRHGLSNLEYCYVVEGKTRRGGSRTGLHLHGFFAADDPLIATRFKIAIESAISLHPKGKAAAGYARHSGAPVDIERAYEADGDGKRGYGRWPAYLAKNILRRDDRLCGRRIFISQDATQLTREFWKLLREEPV